MISENYINRIKALSGIITEGKKDVIANKIGMPERIADTLEREYGKYSIWIANNLKKEIINMLDENPKYIKNSGKIGWGHGIEGEYDIEINSSNINNYLDEPSVEKWIGATFNKLKGEKITYIMDWILGRSSSAVIENDKLNFKELDFDKAFKRAEDWHYELSKLEKGQIEDEQGDVIITFDDGYYWIRLNKNYCEDESEAMGHCGRGEGVIYSLRKNKYPVITADILPNGTVQQIRGRANTKPLSKYHKYIIELLTSKYVSNIDYVYYKREDNFWINDLEDDSFIKKVILEKPELLKGQDFDNFSKENIELIIDKSPNIIPVSPLFDALNLDLKTDLKTMKEHLKKEWVLSEMLEIASFKRGQGPISNLFDMFKKSGSIFYNILLESIRESAETQVHLFAYKPKKMISFFIEDFGVEGKKILQDIFLNQTNLLKFYNSQKKLIDYVNVIIIPEFGDLGLKKAKQFLTNDKFKKLIIKEVGKENYSLILDIVERSLNI